MRILLATGGSGGHIFPALKTAEQLQKLGHEVLLVGALTLAEDRLKQARLPYKILRVEGFKRKTAAGICSFGFLMAGAVVQSMKLVAEFKPHAVAGFGGYSSFPVVLSASLRGVPTLVHEQNVIPGKANRLSLRFARRVAISFEQTKKHIGGRDIIWTGCPCNTSRSSHAKNNLLKKFQLDEHRQTILVLGGSQGSRVLNEVVFETLSYLQAERDIQVIHMTGRTDFSLYAGQYPKLGIPYYVCEFLENIEEAYSLADVVVARAGAGTVCEIAAFERPSILVPYPFAGAHQTANANVLKEAGVAVVIEQKDLTRSTLLAAFEKMQNEGLTPEAVRTRVQGFFVEYPAEKLADAIVNLSQ